MKKIDFVKAIKEVLEEEKPGLWANIRAKRARGEKPAHKNSNAHKDAVKAGKAIKKEEEGGEQETDPNIEITVGDYQTKHYHMCPGAKSLYQDIEDKVDDMDLAVRTAKLQDALFAIEMTALEDGATEADLDAAQLIADQIMTMAKMLGLEKEHNYIQGHVDKIKDAVK